MSDTMASIDTATRVLMAIMDKGKPEPCDVEELRRFAPDCSDLPVDELACEVVQRAVKRRAAGVRQ